MLPYEACSTTSITVLEDFNSLKFSKIQAAWEILYSFVLYHTFNSVGQRLKVERPTPLLLTFRNGNANPNLCSKFANNTISTSCGT